VSVFTENFHFLVDITFMKMVNIYSGHDANVTFYDTDTEKIHIIEIERLLKERYYRLETYNWIFSRSTSVEEIINVLKMCQDVAEKHWGFSNDYDLVSVAHDAIIQENVLRSVFNSKEFVICGDHHHMHAASTFYQSNFETALIISYDGGGNDGFFNIYRGSNEKIEFLEKIESDFGGGYMALASNIEEVTKNSRHPLSLSGKMMGLAAYGEVREDIVNSIEEFYTDKDYKKLSESLGGILKSPENPFRTLLTNYIYSGKEGYDWAATVQKAYENAFLKIFNRLIKDYPSENVCITGGGALNVLLNQIIKDNYNFNLFIAPNPNDCGLSTGASFILSPPKSRMNLAYKGLPILDSSRFDELTVGRKVSELNLDYVSELLKMGKIIGVLRGDSEVGPRALGNRSIICDPSFNNMKDILNHKVKFREWYRPFAPFCLKEDAPTYFESKDFDNFEFMSYAPRVKSEYRKLLPSITHIDGTARLQCVTEDSNKFLFDLLTTFSKYSSTKVLLNTSFNIRGNPILTTIEDALFVLDNTQLDCVIIENKLIEK